MNTLILKNSVVVAYRRLKDGDQSKLQCFFEELGEESRSLFTPHAYDEDTITKVISRSVNNEDRVYIALDDKEAVVAYFFLWWYSSNFPILGVCIADKYQGLGMGNLLVDILIKDGKEGGCKAIELTTVLNNEKAFALYKKSGFQYLGEIDNLVGDGRIVKEIHMYYPIELGVKIPKRKHIPPV